MKGYHFLMRTGHMFNILAQYSERLVSVIRDMGVRGFIKFIRSTIGGRWLDATIIHNLLTGPFQLRLQ